MKSQLAEVMERTKKPELVKHGSEEISKKDAFLFAPMLGSLFDAAAQVFASSVDLYRNCLALLAPHVFSHVSTAASISGSQAAPTADELAHYMDIAIGERLTAKRRFQSKEGLGSFRGGAMRLRVALTAVLLLFAMPLPAFAQWEWGRPHPPKTGACFYRDPGFRGDYFCLNVGERRPSVPEGFNDKITSIRLFRGARVLVYNNGGFKGISLRLDHSMDDLRSIRVADNPSKSWNDRISSIAVFREHDEWER
jgi:hypothetical protein